MPRLTREPKHDLPWWRWGEWALVVLVFALHGGSPVPEVNEPHYLTKARAYWEPEWLPGDLFLDSPAAHHVFYYTCGWWTLVLPLPMVAWLGRLLTWTLLAWGWQRLSRAVIPIPGVAAASAALFVGMCERYHMAGEWIIGGFEAKGIAYALAFFGLSAIVRNDWRNGWLWFGAGSAFHVLVGGWTVIAGIVAWCVSPKRREANIFALMPSLVLGGLLSLPGVLPNLWLSRGIEPSVVSQANLVYMERLPHHLNLLAIPPHFIARHVGLLALWLWLCSLGSPSGRRRRLIGITLGAVAIALAGAAITFATRSRPELAAAILRFYWFRLSDIYLPLGVALLAFSSAYRARRQEWIWLVWLLAAWQLVSVAGRPFQSYPNADRPNKVVNFDDWVDVCQWIQRNTPRDARFLTPRSGQTFKWRAERSEINTWKDIPQDPRGLVEWKDRMERIFRDTEAELPSYFNDPGGLDAARLRELGERYRADYVLGEVSPYCELPVLYANTSYAVYDLRQKSAPAIGNE